MNSLFVDDVLPYLAVFADRMNKNIYFYTGADAVMSTFQLISRVVKF